MNDDDLRKAVEAGEAMGALAGDADHFRAVVDAFRAQDADSFGRLLAEFKVGQRCELVCEWLCSKECVLACLELCGPPPEGDLPGLREFAQVVERITGDEELVERLADAVSERDAEAFRSLVDDLDIGRFCHLLCHWVCAVRCRRICGVLCESPHTHRVGLAEELTRIGSFIGKLASNEAAFAGAEKAVLANDCDGLRTVIDETQLGSGCEVICEWFCTWRCIRVCLLLCRPFPLEPIEDPLDEAFAFAQATARLAANPALLRRLGEAVESSDSEAFDAAVKELELGRFCIQLCHWLCRLFCRRFCVCVCPPRSAAYFIRVGQYQYAEVYPSIGPFPPKIESQIGGTGLTSDTRAFFSTVRLNGGFTLQTGAPQMEYRFETITTDAAGNPSPPAATWQPVLAPATGATIIGYNVITFPVLAFIPVFASLDPQGWIQVPLSSPSYVPTGDLLLVVTEALSNPPHLDETGIVAGAHSSHPLAEDVYFGIRMRVRNVGDPGSEMDAGTCHHIAIDNALYDHVTHQPAWRNLTDPPGDLAVYLVDIGELLGPHGCGQITDSLTVLFTAAHPNLGAVSLRMDGPGGPYSFTLTPDGASTAQDFFGTAAPNGFVVANLQRCAYLITLEVQVLLTTGDSVPSDLFDQIAFCKE